MTADQIAAALEKHPLPWRVDRAEFNGEEYCNGIEDANGENIVCTDSGVYPPSILVAELIVDAANRYTNKNGRSATLARQLLKALRWAVAKDTVCRCLGSSVCEAHQAIRAAEAVLR